ncbi:SA1362 family protein [Cytobacillus sp. FSL W7-1323]|nr:MULTISPECIES: SA1362 family protein [Cytobacillus]MCA1025520.1 hypothetical protein [Cytobacillus kochii]MCM3320622.1 hypothetical protein [Cytobacillus kochii]MCM3344544.1 hypothetical protein [Cytobacillus kochii]MDM5208387.1 SA1362 family protein [Cytobacillus kochii]MEA1853063.1 SA1362 family protein [Cytobacillus sp. OWB-43]
MAFLKNRKSLYIFGALILLAMIGLGSQLIKDPAGLFRGIAIMALVGVVIYFVVQKLSGSSSPNKSERKAFAQAAKKSKKRFKNKENQTSSNRRSKPVTLTSIKKSKRNTSVHLTVIEGKKGKKKNRASL